MRIAIGSDHRGVDMRAKLLELLGRLGQDVVDVGSHGPDDDYPDIAAVVARKVASGEVERGILVGGSGLGMCIAANKIPGVRAALLRRRHRRNEPPPQRPQRALSLRDMLGERLVDRLVEIWLTTPFEGGRHARRIEKITPPRTALRPGLKPGTVHKKVPGTNGTFSARGKGAGKDS